MQYLLSFLLVCIYSYIFSEIWIRDGLIIILSKIISIFTTTVFEYVK